MSLILFDTIKFVPNNSVHATPAQSHGKLWKDCTRLVCTYAWNANHIPHTNVYVGIFMLCVYA